MKDFESYRMPRLAKTLSQLSDPISLMFKPGPTTQRSETPWLMIDKKLTLSANSKVSNVKKKVDDALYDYRRVNKDAKGHWWAMKSTDKAVANCAC